MATPNSEQLLAIEHQGGVLLKAGAGSGKTFVLKEHMIYLSKTWITEYKNNPQGEFDIYIRAKFRKIVLMTFTKKAAGELEIRLISEFEAVLASADEDLSYWEIILANLDYLNVSTIHGFCYKLIKQGFFKGISAEQEILSESEFKEIMKEIFESWIADGHHRETELYEIIVKDKANVFNSIVSIFSDPTLRNTWKETDKEQIHQTNTDEIIKNLFDMFGYNKFFEEYIHPEEYSEFAGKKWYDYIVPLCALKRDLKQDLDGLIKLHEFFSSTDYKIPVKPSLKTVPEPMVEFYEQVKGLKDYLKKNGEHFLAYKESFDTRVAPWFAMIKDLIDYVDAKYTEYEGVTFSDLEYLVYQGLKDDKACELISKEYDYFIIDEFQDTSYIQFSIVEKIIQSNYQKLFCVGDLKQAIYGFRGGELGVFLNCQEKIPTNLTLKNNYRSDSDLIEFNNVFFEYLFEKGHNFKGHDTNKIHVEHQAVPDSTQNTGKIIELKCDLSFRDSDDKISNAEVDYYEALTLFEQIKEFRNSNEESAILYKRLKPSLILIHLLIENDIGFTAQIKIPFLEDPIVGLFYSLTTYNFDSNELKDDYLEYSLKAYFSLMGSKVVGKDVKSAIENYSHDIEYFGHYHAFLNFLEINGIKNSNFKNNLESIHTIINSAAGNQENLLKLLLAQREISYSLEFQYGENPRQIKMMSAHASKGLQFKNVFLGGMYTNENSVTFKAAIGKFPLSFKWAESIHGKKKFKTPLYMYEEELTKNKDFSESKRLFYVANTRAESTLSYVDINFDVHKRMKNQSGSWITGLNLWKTEKLNFESMNSKETDIKTNFDKEFLEGIEMRPPLFHIDNLGIECIKEPSEISFLPEVSVTKLSTLKQCPKKFYYQNICKIEASEIDLIDNPTLNIVSDEFVDGALNSSSIRMSSSERGSFIHEQLSELILNKFEFDFDHSDQAIKRSVLWAVNNLKKYLDNFELISEKPIKFELINYMISGIPDLIIRPLALNDSMEIWDFKTGKYSESKMSPYTFQLMCYAYSQFQLKENLNTKQIKLVLCFVDEKRNVDQTVTKQDVENYLVDSLKDVMSPEKENLAECEYCAYKIICQK